MSDLTYNAEAVEGFKSFLDSMRDTEEWDSAHGDFPIAEGVAVECDWSMNEDEPMLPISVIIHAEGFQLFTRGTGDTLTETGAYGFGPNHGDELAADIAEWVAKNFTDDFEELVFEYSDQLSPEAWLFQAWVPNPNAG